KFSSADPAAQHGVQNSVKIDSEVLGKYQLASIHVAAEQGDHISGEVVGHQGTSSREAEPHLVFLYLDRIPALLRCSLIPVRGFSNPHCIESCPIECREL